MKVEIGTGNEIETEYEGEVEINMEMEVDQVDRRLTVASLVLVVIELQAVVSGVSQLGKKRLERAASATGVLADLVGQQLRDCRTRRRECDRAIRLDDLRRRSADHEHDPERQGNLGRAGHERSAESRTKSGARRCGAWPPDLDDRLQG